ncbi:MAG: efflux RND transporter periplasmic adaptor subunit [Planctomycetota bacterium]|nr:MAG: efflux RND transporter periplasmic adaptor subunit [Planctomycetota bacterium]
MKALLWLLALLGAAAGAWWWLGRDRGAVPVDPDRVIAVQRRDLLKAVVATGRVEPLARVAVMSRASGIIKEIRVEEGDVVRAGDVLVELDREQLEAQLAEDQGNLASAEARRKAAAARVEAARVQLLDPELEFARREMERQQRLLETGETSEVLYDQAALQVAQVEFRLQQVRTSIPELEAGVAQAQADADSARAAVERGQTALREATIRSPMDGVVLLRSKEIGDGVSSILTAGGNATQILTLGDLSAMFVDARVDEVDVGRIYDGMRAVVTVDAYRDQPFAGKVIRIAPAGTVDNNGIVTFEVRVSVEDTGKLLRPDMTANTRLVLEERPGALALPQSALTRRDDGMWTAARLESEDPPRVEMVVVTLGVSDGLMTEILDGLQDGDKVLLPEAEAEEGRGPGSGARRL